MDPISAFALAGTVVTFVDFAGKLVTGTHHIYRSTSGASSVNKELELVASDLRAVLMQLGTPRPPVPSITVADNVESNNSFNGLCENARQLAEELISKLQHLMLSTDIKGARRVWKSLSHAVESAWTEDELTAMMRRLQEIKAVLETRALLELR